MPTVLNPYINFRGTAREAMTFYQGVFGGELVVSTFRDFGMTQFPEAELYNVMHSKLETPAGFVLMGSDVPSVMDLTVGNNVSVSLGGDDGPALTGYYEALSEGGTVTMALSKAPWGDSFGEVEDRFGTHWLVNIAG